MKKDLPGIQMKVKSKMDIIKNEILKLGSGLPSDDMGKLMFLINFNTKFEQDLKKALNGTNFSIRQAEDYSQSISSSLLLRKNEKKRTGGTMKNSLNQMFASEKYSGE